MKYPLWENIFKRPTEESETVLALKGVPIFEELDTGELQEIERLVHRRTYVKDEPIFTQGQPGLGMYIVMSGQVNIIQSDTGGEEQLLAELGQGSFFGDMSLLNDTPRSATARAAELTKLVAFFRPDLFDLLNRQPKTGIKIITGVANVISERLRAQNKVSQELQERVNVLEQQIEMLHKRLRSEPPE